MLHLRALYCKSLFDASLIKLGSSRVWITGHCELATTIKDSGLNLRTEDFIVGGKIDGRPWTNADGARNHARDVKLD